MRQMRGEKMGHSVVDHYKHLSMLRASRSHCKSLRGEVTGSDLHSEKITIQRKDGGSPGGYREISWGS